MKREREVLEGSWRASMALTSLETEDLPKPGREARAAWCWGMRMMSERELRKPASWKAWTVESPKLEMFMAEREPKWEMELRR